MKRRRQKQIRVGAGARSQRRWKRRFAWVGFWSLVCFRSFCLTEPLIQTSVKKKKSQNPPQSAPITFITSPSPRLVDAPTPLGGGEAQAAAVTSFSVHYLHTPSRRGEAECTSTGCVLTWNQTLLLGGAVNRHGAAPLQPPEPMFPESLPPQLMPPSLCARLGRTFCVFMHLCCRTRTLAGPRALADAGSFVNAVPNRLRAGRLELG